MSHLVSFYHYTSFSGMHAIINSGYIRESSHSNNHAHFGEGTYGTSLPPARGQQEISWNNWTRHGHFYIQNGKVSHAIEVKIPFSEVRRVGKKRDILVHPSGPIYLDDYKWKAWTVPRTAYDSPQLLQSSGPPKRQPLRPSQSASSVLQSSGRTASTAGSYHASSSFIAPRVQPATSSPPSRPYSSGIQCSSGGSIGSPSASPSSSSSRSAYSARATQQRTAPDYSSYLPRNSYDYSADARKKENDSLCTIL